MSTFKTVAMVSTLVFIALPISASANSAILDSKQNISTSTSLTSAQQQPTKVVKERMVREVVLSAGSTVSKFDGYRVQNPEGETFINHTVSSDELSPVITNVKFSDTYEFQHNGKTYQNRIVSN